MDREKEITISIELYKAFRESMERSKKNVLDTYRIYIPALFGLLIAISKIKEVSQALENIGIQIVYIIPVIGLFIIVSYAQVVYDLTDVVCLGAYLRFLELKINKYASENIAIWEEKFGEALKMAIPSNKQEKLLRSTYVLIGPIVIMMAWVIVTVGILGITWISVLYSSIFCLIVILLTVSIGWRRLMNAQNFAEKLIKNKNN